MSESFIQVATHPNWKEAVPLAADDSLGFGRFWWTFSYPFAAASGSSIQALEVGHSFLIVERYVPEEMSLLSHLSIAFSCKEPSSLCFYYWDRLVEMLTVTGSAWLELHLYFCPSGDVPGPGMLFTA